MSTHHAFGLFLSPHFVYRSAVCVFTVQKLLLGLAHAWVAFVPSPIGSRAEKIPMNNRRTRGRRRTNTCGCAQCRWDGWTKGLSLTGLYWSMHDRLVCTTHSRSVCTTRSRPMCTTHSRPMCTTHSRPVCTTRSRPMCTTHSRPMCTTHSRPMWTSYDRLV